jgi:pyrrolidone-carboxylate peptidase
VEEPVLLVTGFGPFLEVLENPSGLLARSLDGALVAGARVRGVELSVAFERIAPEYAAALAGLAPLRPLALVSLGVHREGWFRLEERARPELASDRPDNDGRPAAALGRLGEHELRTGLDLEALGEALRRGGAAEVRRSDDAGGYVCERTYYEVLERAGELGVPGLFLHVPPVEFVPAEDQRAPVEALLAEVVRQARSAQ